MKEYSISVMILTYKQSDVIGRTIESVLQQNAGLKEIIISDDCSPDNNWEVIQTFRAKYPELIKAYHNETNLGIYGNAMRLAQIGCSSDLYMILDGDDELCPGWFAEIQKFLFDNHIELRGTKSVVYSDFKTIYPNGEETIRRPIGLAKGQNALGLKLRELLFNRSFLETHEVLEQYQSIDLDHGLPLAEELFDSQVQRFSEHSYYHPYIGSVYHIYSGVTNDLRKKPLYKDRVTKFQWFLNNCELSEFDKNFLRFRIHQNKFFYNENLGDYFKAVYFYLKGTNRSYGYTLKDFVRTFGAMLKILFQH